MAVLPGGIITFLFTNIEGSTRLWERYPEATPAVLRRHNAILGAAILGNGGYIFDIVGDAYYAAFTDPSAALAAALQAQQALTGESWGEIGELRVRMALHTDHAEPEHDGYVSLPLNRVARLLEAGYGGQILLSQTTQQLVRDRLPPQVGLRDLGSRRLRDLLHPMTIFQVVAPGLRTDFPPLKTLDARRYNLPAQPTSFFGRQRETQAVSLLLRRPEVRLVTLTGPGGTGKTRLALRVATELLDEFAHGACFVGLASLSDPGLVITAAAQALGVKELGAQPIAERLKAYLQDRDMLLLLDNFEHLLGAAVHVTELLAAAPRLKILVTSREVLHLYGEYEFPVPPLDLPAAAEDQPDLLLKTSAVALFVERARAVHPGMEFDAESLQAVVNICTRLDGLPLAIELAAAWSRLLDPHAILARLNQRFELLVGGARDLPARQQSLRAAIDWSYELLNEDEKWLFTRLGIFAGGCTVDAVAVVVAGLEHTSTLADLFDQRTLPGTERRLDDLALFETLASLVDKSLLRQEEIPSSDGTTARRFVMLETIREYARERLAESGGAEELRRRYAEYYLALAQRCSEVSESEDDLMLERLEHDYDNVRAVMEWSQVSDSGTEIGLKIGWALRVFWEVRGHLSEGRYHLERILARPDSAAYPLERARALLIAGRLAFSQGDLAAARLLLQSAQDRFAEVGDEWGQAIARARLGGVFFGEGDLTAARSLLQQSLAAFRANQNLGGCIFALNMLGEIARYTGDDQEAEPLYREALKLSRETGSRQRTAITLQNLGQLATRNGDYQRAESLFRESLQLHARLGHRSNTAVTLAGFAHLAEARSQFQHAAKLLGAVDGLLSAVGASLERADQAEYDRCLSAVRAQLPLHVFEAAWAEGRALHHEQAIELALNSSAGSKRLP